MSKKLIAMGLVVGVSVTMAGAAMAADAAAAANPLLAKWTGPYQGVPPFYKVKVADFKPALEAGMAEQLAEIDKIANDPAAPTFDNTIAALERAGRALTRVNNI